MPGIRCEAVEHISLSWRPHTPSWSFRGARYQQLGGRTCKNGHGSSAGETRSCDHRTFRENSEHLLDKGLERQPVAPPTLSETQWNKDGGGGICSYFKLITGPVKSSLVKTSFRTSQWLWSASTGLHPAPSHSSHCLVTHLRSKACRWESQNKMLLMAPGATVLPWH